MREIERMSDAHEGIAKDEIIGTLEEFFTQAKPHKVLLLPPDFTRVFSGVGSITAACVRILRKMGCAFDIMPALGTHEPMASAEIDEMFEGEIAPEDVLVHDWRHDVVKLGEVPASYVQEVSKGIMRAAVPVEVNYRLLDKRYDLIFSLGQVVPHEVAGMANYSKNIFVGCGGYSMINSSHLLGASWGVRRILGTENNPVRAVFDYAQEHFLSGIPLVYLLAVSAPYEGTNRIRGIYIGNSRELFTKAAGQSVALNITRVDKPAHKIVAYMEEKEYKTVWVSNKAVYRTCMALEEGGELIVVAPGVRRFGEDIGNDKLIRCYGYHGTQYLLDLMEKTPELAAAASVVAHLMHGSPDGKFTVTYATDGLSADELNQVGYAHMPLSEAVNRYMPTEMKDGFYKTYDGEAYMLITHPGAGLWTL